MWQTEKTGLEYAPYYLGDDKIAIDVVIHLKAELNVTIFVG